MTIFITSFCYMALFLLLGVSGMLEFDVYQQLMQPDDPFSGLGLVVLGLIVMINVGKLMIYRTIVRAPDKRLYTLFVPYLCLSVLLSSSMMCTYWRVSEALGPVLSHEAGRQEALARLKDEMGEQRALLSQTFEQDQFGLKSLFDEKVVAIKANYAPQIKKHWDMMEAEKNVLFKFSDEYRGGPKYRVMEKLWHEAKAAQQAALNKAKNLYDSKQAQALADYKTELNILTAHEQTKRAELASLASSETQKQVWVTGWLALLLATLIAVGPYSTMGVLNKLNDKKVASITEKEVSHV